MLERGTWIRNLAAIVARCRQPELVTAFLAKGRTATSLPVAVRADQRLQFGGSAAASLMQPRWTPTATILGNLEP